MSIIKYVKTTKAFDNQFFRHCKEWQVTRDQLSLLAVNWECVTRSFWRATCVLVGELAGHYHKHHDLIRAVLKIAAEDGGFGGGAVNGKVGPPHHLLYRQMWEAGTCDWNRPLEPETKGLTSGFPIGYSQISSASFAAAIGMVVVVETIAYNIVVAMWHAHVNAGFNPEKLDYLRLHKTLEIEHADGMGAVYEMAQAAELNPWPHVREGCKRWARFWDAMDRITFGS